MKILKTGRVGIFTQIHRKSGETWSDEFLSIVPNYRYTVTSIQVSLVAVEHMTGMRQSEDRVVASCFQEGSNDSVVLP